MEEQQGYGSDSSGDALPAASAAPAMEVEMVAMVNMGRASSRAPARAVLRLSTQQAPGDVSARNSILNPPFCYKTCFLVNFVRLLSRNNETKYGPFETKYRLGPIRGRGIQRRGS